MDYEDEYPLHEAINRVADDRRQWLEDKGLDVESWVVEGGLKELLKHLGSTRDISESELKAKWQELDTTAANELEAVLTKTPTIVDVPNDVGTTALRLAVDKGNTAAVAVLLKHGANEAAAKEYGSTVLHVAIQNGDKGMVELLLNNGVELMAKEEYGSTTLHTAVRSENVEMVKMLLEKGADIKATEEGCGTALHVAVSSGKWEMVELLLNKGADVTATEEDGRTPLHVAACYRSTTIARLLLGRGASITDVTKNRRTVLHFAACYSNTNMVELLWKKAADEEATKEIDEVDENGNNPLGHMISALHDVDDESVAVAHFLCSQGSQPELQLSSRSTPLQDHQLGLQAITQYWGRRFQQGKPLMRVRSEVVKSGEVGVNSYLKALETATAGDFVYRSKICVVGPSTWGKTTLVKMMRDETSSAADYDDRTIGIDLFSFTFESEEQTGNGEPPTSDLVVQKKSHDVTFWDFAGQDIYQVAHALFFSRRTLYLVCIHLGRYVEKIREARALPDMEGEEILRRFFEENVLRWMRLVLLRQPDAQFKMVGTHCDLVAEGRDLKEIKNDVQLRLKAFLDDDERQVEISPTAIAAMRKQFKEELTTTGTGKNCRESIETAKKCIEGVIAADENLSFETPPLHTQVFECIVKLRRSAAGKPRQKRFAEVIKPVITLSKFLMDELSIKDSDDCHGILRILHNLGEVVWYHEDTSRETKQKRGEKRFSEYIILDPTIMLDIVSEVVNHVYEGEQGADYDALRKDGTLRHSLLMQFPSWKALHQDMVPLFKQLLVQLKLAYPANSVESLDTGDMIVPAYWKTKKVAQGVVHRLLARTQSILDQTCGSGTYVAQWQYSLPVSVSETIFVNFVVQCYRSDVRREVGTTFLDCVVPGEFVGSIKFTPQTQNQCDDITIRVDASTAEIAWAEMQYFVVAMELVLKDYPGLESPEKRRIKRSVISSATGEIHGVTDLMNSTRQEAHLRQDLPWLPPDFAWFLQCAWETAGRLDYLQLSRDLAVLKKLISNDKKRQYPAVWTLTHDQDKNKVELRMHSELTGLCYHDPLQIDGPSFFGRYADFIKAGIMLLSVASAAIPFAVASAAVGILLSESLSAVDRARQVQDVLGDSQLNGGNGNSSLDQNARMAKLRDILLLHSPAYDELTVGAVSKLCCATTKDGDYVWVHSSELGRLDSQYTPRTPITFYINDVTNLPKRDFWNVYCEWKITNGAGAIRDGKTDAALDSSARALWIRAALEVENVHSIAELRTCTLEVVVKRHRRYTGCFRRHKEIARVEIKLSDCVGENCKNFETIEIKLKDTPAQPSVTCSFAIPQSKD